MTSSSSERPIQILYIAGWGRSGSTLLGDLLGKAEGFSHHGELRFLWDRGLLEDQRCSCGESFHRCSFWKAVLEKAFGSSNPGGLDLVRAELSRLVRTRQAAQRSLGRRRGSPPNVDPAVLSALAKLYRALHEVSGAEILVDSSKLPAYGELLATLPGAEVTTIHLIRDPRAVAFSWRRRRANPATGKWMARHSVLRSSVAWLLTNLEVESIGRGGSMPRAPHRLRYEDLMTSPVKELRACLAEVGRDQDLGQWLEDGEVELELGHNLSGNPLRFTVGRVALGADDEWKRQQSLIARMLVTAITLPLLSRYRYPGWIHDDRLHRRRRT